MGESEGYRGIRGMEDGELESEGVGARGRPYAFGESGDGGSAAEGCWRKYSRSRELSSESILVSLIPPIL